MHDWFDMWCSIFNDKYTNNNFNILKILFSYLLAEYRCAGAGLAAWTIWKLEVATEFVKHGPRCWLKEPAPAALSPEPAGALGARNTGIWPQASHLQTLFREQYFHSAGDNSTSISDKSKASYFYYYIKKEKSVLTSINMDEWCKSPKYSPCPIMGWLAADQAR